MRYTTLKSGEIIKDGVLTNEALQQALKEQSDQPIVHLVNMVLEQAVMQKASDIHIEPQDERMRIRFRIDGYLVPYMEAGVEIVPALIARIKFISGMHIGEKCMPQNGRINYRIAGKDVDLRISSMPSIFGEKIVIRIATALDFHMGKDEIGFLPVNLRRFDKIMNKDHGFVLVTGPTGSGKTTTLYSALREKRSDDINIITIENPVETIIEGITQVDVNTKADLNFAAALRSILRQDPDIVMVGEIGDGETAVLAASAAITGRLVLSTLHTFDAPSAAIRLMDMGVEPFVVSEALAGVISQRLIRKICPKCKTSYEATQEERDVLNVTFRDQDEKIILHKGQGCEHCNGTGYQGRTAIHEVMPNSSNISKAIYERAGIDEIRKVAVEEGMVTLYENARIKLLEGTTSYEELLKLHSSY